MAAMAFAPAPPAFAEPAAAVDVDIATSITTMETYLVSQPFSTSAGNELLVAMFSADGPNSPGVFQSVTEVTGCGLTWTEAGRASDVAGVAAVFTAYATGTVTDCEVSGELLYPFDGLVQIISFTGADPQVASVWNRSDSVTGAGFGVVPIPADNTRVYQVGRNWSVAETPFAGVRRVIVALVSVETRPGSTCSSATITARPDTLAAVRSLAAFKKLFEEG